MWTVLQARGLWAADILSAYALTRALRTSSSALDNLPEGGFRMLPMDRAEAAKAWRRARAENGLCRFCSGPAPADGGAVCDDCRAARAGRARELKRARRAVGLCGSCGGPRDADSRLCSKCLAVAAGRQSRLRAAGLCGCGRPPTPGYLTCAVCRARVAARRARRAAAGLCERCPAPARPGMTTCKACGGRRSAKRSQPAPA